MFSICQICQIEFKHRKNRPQKFCSRKCWNLYQTGPNNTAWKGVKTERECEECKNIFFVKTNQRINIARFCSFKCKANNWNRNGWPRANQKEIECSFCKIKFKRIPARIVKNNFCSRKCASCFHSKNIRGTKNGRYVHGEDATPYPVGWTISYKEIIRKRDKYICQLCNQSVNHTLHVHHIDYKKENLEPNNLISLCKYCHGKMHGKLSERLKWKEKLSNLLKESIDN